MDNLTERNQKIRAHAKALLKVNRISAMTVRRGIVNITLRGGDGRRFPVYSIADCDKAVGQL